METWKGVYIAVGREQFKSYYVVWKLKIINIAKTKYKSFKSYYVVWKLFFCKKDTERDTGLNRTMQYGNY